LNSCSSTSTIHIEVYNLPDVTISLNIDSVCLDSGIQILSGGNPVGGSYSGPGVSGNNFDPLTAGLGIQLIEYNFIDTNGCSNVDTSSIVVVNWVEPPNSVLEWGDEINIYPNPFVDKINITGIKNDIRVSLTNSIGEVIKESIVTDSESFLSIEMLPPGLYFLTLQMDGRIRTFKMMRISIK
jgi:hypothetical protein